MATVIVTLQKRKEGRRGRRGGEEREGEGREGERKEGKEKISDTRQENKIFLNLRLP